MITKEQDKMYYEIESGQTRIPVHIKNEDNGHNSAICNNIKYAMDFMKIHDGHFLLRLNGNNFDVLINTEENNSRKINVNGKQIQCKIYNARTRKLQELSKAGKNQKSIKDIKAPMPGLVLYMHVKEGDEVKANDGLLIIEAMKMENEIRATSNGVVKKINVKEGQAIEKGSLLLQLE